MSYHSINSKTATLVNSLKNKEKIKILFVCLGNICRSPAADGIFNHLVRQAGQSDRWEIDSAGTGGWHVGDLPDKRMRLHARDRGYVLDHICRKVRVSDFDHYDLIIGMDQNNVSDLKELAPTLEAEAKVIAMADFLTDTRFYAIPDPYYEGSEGFELVLDLLETACHRLLTLMTP